MTHIEVAEDYVRAMPPGEWVHARHSPGSWYVALFSFAGGGG